eukprot:NODE_2202_length_498_cov_8.378619_g1798_i0.p1 GENE.NODE_2202_length_498_cov_8.378619_g1798_i0~~NODE_2202_length_498_cov_8.378619_g1798_i0.p1  ORF type:complete len:73 (+),score=4.65 NODE_2202_length_498_cov_8.378619_g1798_i0:248-466(+)
MEPVCSELGQSGQRQPSSWDWEAPSVSTVGCVLAVAKNLPTARRSGFRNFLRCAQLLFLGAMILRPGNEGFA